MMEKTTPTHIAIIMDGNGRWAAAQTKPRVFGHQQGAKTLEELVDLVVTSYPEIRYLTVFAFATKNKKREQAEVNALTQLFDQQIVDMTPGLLRASVRTRIIGDRNDPACPDSNRESIKMIERETGSCTGINLQIAWFYSGENEVARAEAAGWSISRLYSSFFDAPDVPAVDLMIRTGAKNDVGPVMRISDFVTLQSAQAVMVPLDIWWPAFGKTDLDEALARYNAEAHLDGGQRQTTESAVAAE